MKNILVIGATSKIAIEFIKAVKDEFSVYATYRPDSTVHPEDSVTSMVLDLADKRSVTDFIEKQQDKQFAGVFVFASTYQPDELDTIEYLMNAEKDIIVNATSPVIILKKLRYEQGASVFLFGDSGLRTPKINHTSYSISKEILSVLCKILAVELADSARVHVIKLGPTMAPQSTDHDAYYSRNLVNVANPVDGLVEYCLFLLGEKNLNMTGAEITYDGGTYLRRMM